MNYQEELARLQLEDRKKKENGRVPFGCLIWVIGIGFLLGFLVLGR